MTTKQRSVAPTRKVQASGLAGTATVLIIWVAGQFGVVVPPEVAAALTTLLSFAASYLTPPSEQDGVTRT